MSDDWAITPPSSPQLSQKGPDAIGDDFYSGNAVLFLDDWNIRMFCCMGESQNTAITFHSESYLKKNDLGIFFDSECQSELLLDDFGPINLFGNNFDKGAALIEDADVLFKLAKHAFIQLDFAAKAKISGLGTNCVSKKSDDYSKQRENMVHFFIYIRNYIQRVGSCSKYHWLAEHLFSKLHDELSKFRVLCGSMDKMSDYIINHSANSIGNRSTQPSYHLFHCQLDIKWLHITLLYQLISLKQKLNEKKYSGDYGSLSFRALDSYLEHLISDLIIVALKRFQQISNEDLPTKSLFTCTCVRELWKLLQLCIEHLHSCGHTSCFWDFINRISEKMIIHPNQESIQDCSSLQLPLTYSCSNPPLFNVWLLKNLVKLWTVGEKLEIRSNYPLLENSIKMCFNSDPSESHLRVFMNFVENILNCEWEMRTDPLVLLWEYFNKKLNSLFYVPGAAISGLAVMSNSALGLLTQLNNKLDLPVPDKNTDSFHLFLRLLGRNLKKWQDNPRFWNQLKGRIFSKFSASKLLSLNEMGLYHFVSLFLTLAITTDLNEVSKKLQYFLSLLNSTELDEARLKLIWKTHLAIILLFAENDRNINCVSNWILDAVEISVQQPDRVNLMRIFTEGLQDLLDCTNNLELGQYLFIGSWISTYLSQCSESDASRFLETILSLINKLHSLLSAQLPVSQDNQLIHLNNALWEHLIPYLKKMCSSSHGSYQIPDISAALTTLSLKSCFSTNVRYRAFDFLTYFVSHDFVEVRLLCRYLSQISRSVHVHSLNNLSISLIKGWLRCLILLSGNDEFNEDLSTLNTYIIALPEIQKLFSETQVTTNSQSDYFENFLIVLQLKYSSLSDLHVKHKFVNQICSYFVNVERWLSYVVRAPKSVNLATNIYRNVGQMFFKIPDLLYTKSRPNSMLQSFIDLLLLPVQIRNPQFKLNVLVSQAIKDTMYLFVCGLFKLDPENDPYIYRTIKDLLVVYVPRVIPPKGTSLSYGTAQFSLLKCFDFSERFELMGKLIIEVLCNVFIKKRTKIPHQFAYQALLFFNDLIRSRKHNDAVVKCFITNALETICDVVMFCDDVSPCRKEAKDILQFILDLHIIRSDLDIGNDLMEIFIKLCNEHLAFTSRTLFNLFEEIISVAPDLVARFLPQLVEKVKEVECKRGVGFDRSLRKGLEQIQGALKNIRNKQNK